MTSEGRAVLAPRSVRNLQGEALEAAGELERVVLEIEQLRARAYELAVVLRDLGASWAAIGWVMGVTDTRARQIVTEERGK